MKQVKSGKWEVRSSKTGAKDWEFFSDFASHFALLTLNCLAEGKAGTTSAEFLKIGVGARAIGMGETQAALANDAFASYWNPAGLGSIKIPEVSVMYNRW